MTEPIEIHEKSTFITVVAWIFIVLTGFGTFMTCMQNIMIFTMFSTAEMQEAMNHQDELKDMPFFVRFMFQHIQLYFLFMFFLTAATFVSSIGLLKRKNWARKVLISILGFGILFVISGFVIQLITFSPMSHGMPQEEIPVEFTRMMTIMKVVMFIFATGITCLFGWIIKKLLSRDIIAEFTQTKKIA